MVLQQQAPVAALAAAGTTTAASRARARATASSMPLPLLPLLPLLLLLLTLPAASFLLLPSQPQPQPQPQSALPQPVAPAAPAAPVLTRVQRVAAATRRFVSERQIPQCKFGLVYVGSGLFCVYVGGRVWWVVTGILVYVGQSTTPRNAHAPF